MSHVTVGQAVMTVIRQTVYNLDVQRDQIVEAIERDYPSDHPDYPSTNPEHERAHRELRDFFAKLAEAREALVDSHNLLRDVVAPIDLKREVRS